MSEVSKSPKKTNDATVQSKLSELSELVAWFQSPSFSLEEAVTKFKQAEALAEQIEKDLTKLKNDITVIKRSFDGDTQ